MKFKSLAAKLNQVFSETKRYVYTLVPQKALNAVLENGLYSSKALLDRPDLMKYSTHPDESVEDWKKKIKRDLKDDFRHPAMLGPSVFFHYPPNTVKLNPKHPINLYGGTLLKIDIDQLLTDIPQTKFFGMELTPFDEDNPDALRHRYISADELTKFINMSPEENWKDYADLDDLGLYAPNVPHAAVHTPDGIIPAKYISKA